ncbi:MAG: TIGR04282 family arsenosugar biosynthesis glycosyltransferase, partial [Opitutaceae bacterium]
MNGRLILMLKYPRPGAVKTRLIPALGEQRACELYRALVRHTLAEADRLAASGGVTIEARVAGAPDEAAARAWLGGAMTIRDQGEGDLGQRMERAVHAAFAEDNAPVVVIGGDCPQLAAEHLAAAFAALEHADAVIGPAADGGYYLIGLRRSLPPLFHGIRWGGAEVLAQTLAAARALSVDVVQLATLRDLDVPEDLPVWAETAAARAAGRGGVSVIIPVLDEEERLPTTLAAVQQGGPHEVIVVDGGSTDRTVEIARAHDTIMLAAPPGRARQMNCGAAVATGEYLLFLHADTIPPDGYVELLSATLAVSGVVGGAFEFAISGEFPGRQLIERGTNWRARRRQMPYGDQGIFVRREIFARVGGFPDLPIMEDYEFVRRLRRLGTIALAPGGAVIERPVVNHVGDLPFVGFGSERRGNVGRTINSQEAEALGLIGPEIV